MDTIEILGFFAGACTTLAFLPQVFQIWKTKSVQDISLGMYIVFITGITGWMIYGIFKQALPIILSNSITLILSSAILMMKLMWSRNK